MGSKVAEDRKQTSQKILTEQGVPFIEHLPTVEDEESARIRTVESVARRAMALCVVSCKGEGLEHARALEIVQEYELESELSPKEHVFVFNPDPEERDRIQFSWMYECYWVMLWALGYVDSLGTPDQVCDVENAVRIMVNRDSDQFVGDSKLRAAGEILDALDLTYRYDWACVDSRHGSTTIPDWLNCSVVVERHRALNWLVGYPDNADWDDVTMDT